MRLIASGDSFRRFSFQLLVIYEEGGIAEYGGTSDVAASNYGWTLCAVALQKVGEKLQMVWALSMGFDYSTRHGCSYWDIQARVFFRRQLRIFHLVVLPMVERHTGQRTPRCCLFTFRCCCTMTDRICRVMTQIEGMLCSGVVCVWCGLLQRDLVMQDVFEFCFHDLFLNVWTKLISYLRRKKNLIGRMGSECSMFCTVR